MTKNIEFLEKNIHKLIHKLVQLKDENMNLKEQLHVSNQKLTNQSLEMESLNQKLESLKIVNTLLGGEENKRETKLKINLLIREIDYCIAELSE